MTGRAQEVDRGLPTALSSYLDLLRVVAALWVLLSHFRGDYLAASEFAWLLPGWGHDAVIIFFVLSGFVIANAQARKRGTLAQYAADRATRIYSVVVPILLACWLVEGIGTLLAPAAYAGSYELRKLWIYLPLHLLFLGEVWTLREVPNLIVPYWSLNFEVWYYVLFAILVFYRGAKRVLLVGAVLAMLGPQHLLMWPAWLAGVALWRVIERWPLSPGAGRALFAATLAAYAAIETLGIDRRLTEISTEFYTDVFGHAPGNGRTFLADYLLAALVALNIHAFRWSGWQLPAATARAAAWMAGYSFTLYLLHAPLIIVMKRAIGSEVPTLGASLALLAATLVATIIVGELTEKRREAFRKPVTWLIDKAARLVAARPGLSRLIAPAG